MNRATPSQLWPGLAPQWILDGPEWLEAFFFNLYKCFVFDDRYGLMLQGLGNTLRLTLVALLIGIALGVVVALVRVTWDKNGTELRGLRRLLLRLANLVSKLYLTVIRGTPVMVQILIMYLVIFKTGSKFMVGCLAFGVNSGAYVAEIIRSGIMSVDAGQTEAGRSLGFNYIQTMRHIVVPQALKAVLPALANEFIVLLKETSVVGYIGMMDLTYAANTISGTSFVYFYPLLAAALIYLVMVVFFTWLVGKLERRLRASER